jgi:hypothetical protein
LFEVDVAEFHVNEVIRRVDQIPVAVNYHDMIVVISAKLLDSPELVL